MEAAVKQYFVDKQCFEIQKKQFLIENDRLLDQIISQDIVNIVVNSSMDINTFVNVNSSAAMNDSVNYVEMCNKCLELEAELIKQHNMVEKDEYNRLSKSFSKLEQHCISLELAMQLNKEIFQKNNTSVNQTEPLFDQLFELNNLKAELQAKDTTIEKLKTNIKCLNKTYTTNRKSFCHNNIKNDLRKFKGKDIVDNAAQVSNATTIAPGMYKLDLVTLAPKDKNNRETHIYYLKHTMEQADILREIVEQAKSLNPLDSASYSACKSKSTDNIKNDRILQISSSTQKKNKVEDNSRIVKSCLNKPICVVEPSGKANVHHSKLNTNSELMCVKCNSSMFDARHELCFLEFVSDMNASSKSKSVKKAKKKEEWKPTGKVFTKIGYNWRPTGRTFTLVGNACPLTRITATNKVPLREPIPLEVVAQESVVTKVYTRRPKVPKTNGSNSKPKIAKSVISNKTEPGTSRGSNTSVAPSSSSLVDLSSGLVTNPIPQQPCNLPLRDDWDRLFQPMFDEYFNPPTIAVSLVPVVAAPRAVNLADSHMSTSIDQNALSTKSPKTPHFHDDLLHESLHEDSTSQGSSSNVRPIHTSFESLGRWTKDHPIANVIEDPYHSISTRKQLQTDAM
ncbi:hypothetical protein Tco_1168289 [Tanacetum coccineum]